MPIDIGDASCIPPPPMTSQFGFVRTTRCILSLIGGLVVAQPAHADRSAVSFGGEAAIAFPVSEHQRSHFRAGGGGTLSVGYDVLPSLSVHARGGGFGFSGVSPYGAAALGTLGAGVRLHLLPEHPRLDPWVDANVLYVHTGSYASRLGADAGVGVHFAIEPTSGVAFGPFVRGMFVRSNADTGHAGILMAGISVQWHPWPSRPVVEATVPVAPVVEPTEEPAPAPQPEAPAAEPQPEARAEVTEERIEINQRVEFLFDSTELLESSSSILDAVAEVLRTHAELRVRVEGHTDNVGTREHNLRLSRARAEAVVRYLVDHGVAQDRLSSEGFGTSRPVGSNDTDEGRAQNRRVEFVIVR